MASVTQDLLLLIYTAGANHHASYIYKVGMYILDTNANTVTQLHEYSLLPGVKGSAISYSTLDSNVSR